MRLASRVLLVAAWLLQPAFAGPGFGNYSVYEFAPARGQTFAIPFVLEQDSRVEITIFGPGGASIRTLASTGPLSAGSQTLVWDGKDNAGMVVPDEAYMPVLKIIPAEGAEMVIDPRATSGGEALEDIRVEITASQDIAYYLPVSARVLIRVGIKAGPMLRSLAAWEPRGPGKNIQHWDGRDSSGLRDIRSHERLGILVRAFQLPQYAIITTSNEALDYRRYQQQKGWPEPMMINPKDPVLLRGDQRIAREYYVPHSQYADPRVALTLGPDLERSPQGLPCSSRVNRCRSKWISSKKTVG